MDTMLIRTSFTPLRMVTGQRTPVALNVEVKNKTEEERNYAVTIKVPTLFGFDKANLMKEKRERILKVKPGESKDAVFTIYGKFNVPEGYYDFNLTVRELGERLDKPLSQSKTVTTLRVVNP